MKRTSTIAVIAMLTLTGMLAHAQKRQPPDPAQMVQHRVDFLTQKLGLSTAQQQQATTIFTNAATNMKSLHEQMRTAHENLQAATQKNDSAGIDQASNAIGNLMAQATAARAKTDAAFYQTLNPDQQAKYNEIDRHGLGGRGFGWHRRGGHGGPPPF
jgi:Spy/CpxP family protein refolding chaperone